MMKISLLYLAILGVLASAVLALPATHNVEVQPLDIFNTLMKAPEYIQDMVKYLIMHLAFLDRSVDTIPFKNFTFDLSFFFREGEANTYQPTLSGLSRMIVESSVDANTKGFTLDIKIPEAVFLGQYDLWRTDIGWPFPGDTHYKGVGEFNHTFYNVHIAANFTLVEEDGRVKVSNVSPLLNFMYCSLWAQNYTINGQEADWTQISNDYKASFDADKAKYDVILKESIAWAFNVPVGLMGEAFDMGDVIYTLEVMGEYWRQEFALNGEAKKADSQPRDYFNQELGGPEYVQAVVLQFFNFLMIGVSDRPLRFQNVTHDLEYVFQNGTSNTYNPTLSGLSQMELTMNVDRDMKNVMMDVLVPLVIFQGRYDWWMDKVAQFWPDLLIDEHRGEGRFDHKFYDVHFTVSYTLVEEDGRIKAKNIRPTLDFTQCILSAEKYTIDGVPVDDFFEVGRNLKRHFDENKVGYKVILEESVAWALNVPWGVMEMDMDTVLSLLESIAETA